MPYHHHALAPFDKRIFKRPLARKEMKRADRNAHIGPQLLGPPDKVTNSRTGLRCWSVATNSVSPS